MCTNFGPSKMVVSWFFLMLHLKPNLSALAKFEVLSALRCTVLQGFPMFSFLRSSLYDFSLNMYGWET